MLSIADRPDQALGKRRSMVLFLATLIAGWRIASTGRVFSAVGRTVAIAWLFPGNAAAVCLHFQCRASMS